jgi:Icc-related predicted phosphoesterase
MHIAAISDLHGHLPEVPPCDVLLIGGDVCPVVDHSIEAQARFLAGPFADWLAAVPAKQVVGVAGNHDLIFEIAPERVPNVLRERWTYLQDSEAQVEGLRVYGSPWQPVFFNWAFNLTEPELAEKWVMIPAGIDVLLLHGPPRGIGDRNDRGQHTGSPSLLERIDAVRPKLVVFGHIHEGRGRWERNGAVLANVTLLDERYRRVYEPMLFDLP